MIVNGSGPGARSLREALADVEGPSISWGHRTFDGLQQLDQFRMHSIPSIEFTTSLETANAWVREFHYEVWGRLRSHTRGNDIVPSHHRFWRERDFWVRVIPTILSEWRIHVWDGRAFRTGVKVRTHPPLNPRSRIAPLAVRSERNGWDLKYNQSVIDSIGLSVENRKTLRSVAVEAVDSLAYLHGAVDIGWTPEGPVVFEVNSAPALGDFTLQEYVRVIKDWASAQPVVDVDGD